MTETRILGIETSCDETAAAVVADGRRMLANVVASQVELHAQYGGVFPEMASRAHIEMILPVIQEGLLHQEYWKICERPPPGSILPYSFGTALL